MRFGDVKLRVVSDGIYWADGAGLFGVMPKVEWKRVMAPDKLNRVPVDTRSLIIETSDSCILVDTGYGDKLSDKERDYISLEGDNRLLRNLEAFEIGPKDVDLVVNTHLHNDHCGGNTRFDEKGELVPTFPHAMYCAQRLEVAEAKFPNERTRAVYHRHNFEPVDCAYWTGIRSWPGRYGSFSRQDTLQATSAW